MFCKTIKNVRPIILIHS